MHNRHLRDFRHGCDNNPPQVQQDVGVYDDSTGERLAVGNQEFLTLGIVDVDDHPEVENSAPVVNFNNKIELTDYRIDRTLVAPGGAERVMRVPHEMVDFDQTHGPPHVLLVSSSSDHCHSSSR